jgi:hypothetical protein
MPIIVDKELYDLVKHKADEIYKKSSAYKSGYIVKKYKELGGRYEDDNEPKNLKRWYQEKWKDIGHKEYSVYRPTLRINKNTPLTINEIDKDNLKKQIKLKQIIKGDKNLKPFMKGSGINQFSDPKVVYEKAKKYLGKDVDIKLSDKPTKKYMILNPHTNKWIYFGQMGYEDFTKHKDLNRRQNYLRRTENMRGNWKDNKYSANNLSRNILW